LKIIDEKGRLFGTINIIDFIVILFLLSFIPMLYFGYKAVTAESYVERKNWVDIQVRFQGVIPEVAGVIREGDVATDPLSKVNMQLIAIYSIKSSEEIAGRKDITVNLRLPCTTKQGFLLYRDKPARIGESITFATDLYTVTGTIIGIEKK